MSNRAIGVKAVPACIIEYIKKYHHYIPIEKGKDTKSL